MLLKVEMVSICGSDRLICKGERHAQSFPKILGHEVVGHLVQVGDDAAACLQLGPGDRVVVEPYLYCNDCEYCRAGHYHMWVLKRIYGITLDFQPTSVSVGRIWGVHGVDTRHHGAPGGLGRRAWPGGRHGAGCTDRQFAKVSGGEDNQSCLPAPGGDPSHGTLHP